jgi:hypothetical protein
MFDPPTLIRKRFSNNTTAMNIRKLLVTSIITGILFVIFDMLIGILTSRLFQPYAELAIWKTPPDVLAGTVFDLVNGLILAAVYMAIFESIPGTGWKKGLNYGAIVGLFRVIMPSFSTIVMYSVPLDLVITNLVTGYAEILALCVILALVCEKL